MTRYTEVDDTGATWLIHATVKPGVPLCYACRGWIDRDNPKAFTRLTARVGDEPRTYGVHPDCADEVRELAAEGYGWFAALRIIRRGA